MGIFDIRLNSEQIDYIRREITENLHMTLCQAAYMCGLPGQYFTNLVHQKGMTTAVAKAIEAGLGIKIPLQSTEEPRAIERLPVSRDRLVFELRKRGHYLASASQMCEHARDFFSVQFTQNDGFIPKRDIDRLNKRLGILYADIKPLEHNPLTAVSSDKCVRDMTIKELYEIIGAAVRDAMKEVSK